VSSAALIAIHEKPENTSNETIWKISLLIFTPPKGIFLD
jgi:hypothetical protein